MNTIRSRKTMSMSALPLLALLGLGAAVGGCAYGGVATTADGTVIIARNGLLGTLRKVYICKLAGTALTCVESTGEP